MYVCVAACVYVLTAYQIKAICCTRSKGGHRNSGDKSARPPPLTADDCRFHATSHTHTHSCLGASCCFYLLSHQPVGAEHTSRCMRTARRARLPSGVFLPPSHRARNTAASAEEPTSKAAPSLLSQDKCLLSLRWNYSRGRSRL